MGIQQRLAALCTVLLLTGATTGSPMSALHVEFQSPQLIMNGVTTTPQGRRFVVVQPRDSTQPQVAEITTGTPKPYPDAAWNSAQQGRDPTRTFVGVNSLRIGSDGFLWAVDRGAPGIGKPLVAGGPKLVRIDLNTNRVARVYDLGEVAQGKSFVDDVRFNGTHAYLTDAGRPALIALDLASGHARRVLENNPSTTASRPLMAEGRQLLDPAGNPIIVHADQLEVSPDAQWLYFQPCSGPMWRIASKYLDDQSLPPATLASHVQPFAATPSAGGTAIDANGFIYVSDTNNSRILKVSPQGQITTLVSDPRLAWVDAMWIDAGGKLWMPAAQLNRVAALNRGKDAVAWPITIYSLTLGVQPVLR